MCPLSLNFLAVKLESAFFLYQILFKLKFQSKPKEKTNCFRYFYRSNIHGYTNSYFFHNLMKIVFFLYIFFNLPLSSIPLQMFDLSINRIRELRKDSFDRYPKIRLLYLFDNTIQYIEDGTFAHLTNLEVIAFLSATNKSLHRNQLTQFVMLINANFPLTIRTQQVIDLSINALSTISLELFELPYLRHMYYSNNSLFYIDHELKVTLIKMAVLWIYLCCYFST